MFDPELISTIASLLGISVNQLVSSINTYYTKKRTERRGQLLAKIRNGVKKVVSHGLHSEALSLLYPDDDLKHLGLKRYLIEIDGKIYKTANMLGIENLLQIEVELNHKSEQHLLDQRENQEVELDQETVARVLADIKFRGLRIWDQPIYNLLDFTLQNKRLRARFSLISFMQYRLGLGAAWDELLAGIITSNFDIAKLIDRRTKLLPIREMLLTNAKKLSNFQSRICVGGVHTTFAIQRPDPWNDYVIPLQQRATQVSAGQGLMSVIPQAYHQSTVDPKNELSFTQTFYRELYEELFGGKEVTKKHKHLRYDWYMDVSEPVKWFRDNDGSYRIICTGFGINLTNGSYEVSLVCVVRDPNYWKKFSHLMISSWETSERPILVSTKDGNRLHTLLTMPDWDGCSYFSFCNGLKYLSKIEIDRLSLPDLTILCV